jgi:hypothetical protein
MTFLTPLAALAALAALVPLGAWAAGRRRADLVRRSLDLPPPRGRGAARALTGAAAVALLGLAAGQPVLTHTARVRERTDAETLFVFDTSRSMAASATAEAPTRLDRAVAAALRLRAAIPDVPSGVATLTDRVLPALLPVADRTSFDLVARRGVAIESPPPAGTDVRATSFTALKDVAAGGYFKSQTTHKLVVLLTDGESNPVDTGELARSLGPDRGYRFTAVRLWGDDESVYKRDGTPETAYRPDPTGRIALDGLAAALDGRSFEADRLDDAASYLQSAAGTGPTRSTSTASPTRTPLAPYLASLAVLLILVAVTPPLTRARRTVQSAVS